MTIISRLFFLPSWRLVLHSFRNPLFQEYVDAAPGSASNDLVKAERFAKAADLKAPAPPKSSAGGLQGDVHDGMMVLSLLWKMHNRKIVAGVVCSLLQALMATVARPLFLREIIIDVQIEDSGEGTNFPRGAAFAIGVSLCVLAEGFLQAWVKQLLATESALEFLSWCMTLLHKKSLNVKNSAIPATSAVASLVGNDLIRIAEDMKWLCLYFYTIFALIGGIFVLFITLGTSALAGMGVMTLVVIINFYMAAKVKQVEEKDLKKTDERVSATSEMLEGMSAIKLTAWEYPFRDIIFAIRKKELGYIQTYRLLQIISVNLGRASPVLSACASVLMLVYLNPEEANAANLFVAMSTFLALRLPLIALPNQTALLANTFVSLSRIGRFIRLPREETPEETEVDSNILIEVKNASFRYHIANTTDAEEFSLKSISFEVGKNSMTGVVGRVGSGKSTLVSSVLGFVSKTSGVLKVTSNVAYVPQQPFIMSGTLRENILFGREMEQTWYDRCLELSCFKQDLLLFNNGDLEEIGERGQTVSGGQKQRIALARALYARPLLLILDDPLSAVDANVGNQIFNNLKSLVKSEQKETSKGYWKPEASILMSLNQFNFLESFTNLIVLKKGEIVQQGSYDVLKDTEGLLKEMLSAVAFEQQSLTEESPVDTEEVEKSSSEVSETPIKNESNISKEEKVIVKEMKKSENLVQGDYAQRGSVAKEVFIKYLKSMGLWMPFVSLFIGLCAYATWACADLLVFADIARSDDVDEMKRLSFVYMGVSVLHVLLVQSLSLSNMFATVKANGNIHNECINKLLHAPIDWFQSNPSGRIISRFSGDLSLVDRQLQFNYDDLFQFFFLFMALCVVVTIILPQLLPVIVIGIVMFYLQMVAFDRANREVRRYANQALAPVVTNISESMHGKNLIRAMKADVFFTNKQAKLVDELIRFQYASGSLINWTQMFTALVSFALALPASFIVVYSKDSIDAANAGLALTYSFLIPYFLQIISIVLPNVLSFMMSLERILEYLSLPEEPAWHKEKDEDLLDPSLLGQQDKVWPSEGTIEFRNVSLKYRPHLPPAISNISVTFQGRQRTGVVGRTGAGKSSLTLLLFRVHDCTEGSIFIDGVDISTIGLQKLRKNLASIPQTPLLLRGSVRKNLDPFDENSDEDIKTVMTKVGLSLEYFTPKKKKSSSKVIATMKSEQVKSSFQASELSVGQKQLVSLGRILLRQKPKIIVMDEPTANIDQETDQYIQTVMKNEFQDTTILTIAHRLDTIVENDKVLVMDKGRVAEYETPRGLLEKQSGVFKSMVESLGPNALARFKDIAK